MCEENTEVKKNFFLEENIGIHLCDLESGKTFLDKSTSDKEK